MFRFAAIEILSPHAGTPYMACPEISDIHRRLYIEKSCKVFDFFQT